jgi:hypothetical protein
MKTKLLAMMLLAGGSMFAQTRFSVGVGIGGYSAGVYQQPPPYGYGVPPCAPGYIWVDGYCVPDYGPNVVVGGYWNRAYRGNYRVAPRFDNRFYESRGRENFNRGGFEQNRSQGFSQNRDSGNQRQAGGSGRNNQGQNQNRGNRGGSNGSRGR